MVSGCSLAANLPGAGGAWWLETVQHLAPQVLPDAPFGGQEAGLVQEALAGVQ